MVPVSSSYQQLTCPRPPIHTSAIHTLFALFLTHLPICSFRACKYTIFFIVISLIERFYDPSSGALELDHADVKDLNVKWLRSQIGLVSQKLVLFPMSIRENVKLGLTGTPLEKASDEQRMAAVRWRVSRRIRMVLLLCCRGDMTSRLEKGVSCSLLDRNSGLRLPES